MAALSQIIHSSEQQAMSGPCEKQT